MTTDWKTLASELNRELGLQYEPIAITFSDEQPVGVERYLAAERPAPEADGRTGAVAAGCVFWVEANTQTFATTPEDHANCSVGSVTHGLLTLQDVLTNQDVQALLASEWVTPEEAMALPVVQQRYNYVSYGPLGNGLEPDVVLLRVNGFHAMVIKDAFDDIAVTGKPQCHIIAMAKEQDRMALSTGCMLSRIRTGMSPAEMTFALPARRLGELVDGIKARREANAAVAAYANKDLKRFS